MKPYYDDGQVTIYHGDCFDLVDVWDLAGAVLVTDPPYGMAYRSDYPKKGGPSAPVAGDQDTTERDRVLEVWGDRPALVFGTWRIPRPVNTRQLIVWDKGESPGMGDLSMPWGPAHEEVYVLGIGFTGRRKPNVLRYPTLNPAAAKRPGHPTPKPEELMRDLIAYCPPLATIVDPFAGSGTTLRAAKDLGRRAIGVELEERYCEIAARRMGQEVLFGWDGVA